MESSLLKTRAACSHSLEPEHKFELRASLVQTNLEVNIHPVRPCLELEREKKKITQKVIFRVVVVSTMLALDYSILLSHSPKKKKKK